MRQTFNQLIRRASLALVLGLLAITGADAQTAKGATKPAAKVARQPAMPAQMVIEQRAMDLPAQGRLGAPRCGEVDVV